MRNGQNGPRESKPPGRRAYSPRTEALEGRDLLTVIVPLGGDTTVNPPLPGVDTAPYGILELGTTGGGGAGFAVSEVGDVNNDGFDDFAISAPTVNAAGFPGLGAGGGAQVYLVFGSTQVANPNVLVDYLSLNNNPFSSPDPALASQRISSLGQLGNTIQTNPYPGAQNVAAFPFAGVRFIASSTQNSQLGASVARVGDVNGDGIADFMIGAPGANNNAGEAFLIYGGTALSTLGGGTNTIDLDTPPQGFLAARFFSSLPGANAGRAVASASDVIADAKLDIAIGAPNASVNGFIQNGAVYVVSGAFLAADPANPPIGSFDLATFLINSATTPGIAFAGSSSGANAGFSLAGLGTVSGLPLPNLTRGDFLIGAPHLTGTNSPGEATLVYAQTATGYAVTFPLTPYIDLSVLSQTVVTNGNNAQFNFIGGATFTGDTNSDLTGYSVSNGGDFNADGRNDFMIGSPGFNNGQGRVDLILGQPTLTYPNVIGGVGLNLTSLVGGTQVGVLEFQGQGPNGFFGYAMTAMGSINNDRISEIAIGQPGYVGGRVYVIPGNTGLIPAAYTVNVDAVTPNLYNLILQPDVNVQGALGASLSSNLFPNGSGQTVDGDALADLVVGVPYASVPNTSPFAGAAYLLEGAFLPLETPPNVNPPGPPPPPPPPPVSIGVFPSQRFIQVGPALPYGERLVPTNNILRRLNYAPLRPFAAHRQFLPKNGFGFRFNNYYHPNKHSSVTAYPTGKQHQSGGSGVYTLGRRVFSRGRFPKGLFIGKIRHKGPTIP